MHSKVPASIGLKLSHKMLLVFAVTISVSMALLALVTRGFLLKSFARLETEQISQDVSQAKTALEIQLRTLDTTAEDYAYWDQAYRFLKDPEHAAFDKEFQDAAMEGLGVNFILVQDAGGNTVFYKELDSGSGTKIDIPERVRARLTSARSLQVDALYRAPLQGILQIGGRTFLVSARAVLTSQREGPPLGAMLFGKRFDREGPRILSELTRAEVDLRSIADKDLPETYRNRLPRLFGQENGTESTELGENRIAGYALIRDIFGDPAVLLKVETPRPIHQRGLLSANYVMASVMAVALLSSLAILIFFKRFVLSPIERLGKGVESITTGGSEMARLKVAGSDEIAGLGRAINGMLDDLQKSQMQFELLAQNIHQAFWTRDARTGKYQYISRAFEEIWGQSRERMFSDPAFWRKTVHSEDRQAFDEMARSQGSAQMGEAHYRITLAGGKTRWIWERYFPVFDEAGEFVQIIGLAEDISKFKLGEQALLKAQEELETRVEQRTAELAESSRTVRLLLEAVPHGVFGISVEGSCTFCNPACLQMLGYGEARDMLGKNLHDLIHHTRADGSAYPREECPLVRTLQSGEGVSFDGDVYWRKDGTAIPVEVWSHPYKKDGNVEGAVVTFIDISERKTMEMELRHSQKLEAVGRLAAGIAHEINTPIQFIGDNTRFLQDSFRGVIELMSHYEELEKAARKEKPPFELVEQAVKARLDADWEFLKAEIPQAMEQMLEGLGRVATIVRGMKEFSHVDRSTEKTEADLNRALTSTLVVARNELKYVADVETNFGELPRVPCHLGDLNQVFLNLLINAVHAIEDVVRKTNGRGKIEVTTRREGNWVEVAVSDTGGGIPEAIQGKIFDPFFTTKEVGKGTGQGLALARAIIVEKHRGTLTFQSKPGVGTTFFVRLPLAAVTEPEEAMAQ